MSTSVSSLTAEDRSDKLQSLQSSPASQFCILTNPERIAIPDFVPSTTLGT